MRHWPRAEAAAAQPAAGGGASDDDGLSEADAAKALEEYDQANVRGCAKCVLHEQRTQAVFGDGCARPELVFVGEGPGADEDKQGIPFVGRAGQLLTKMIEAMSLTRKQVYICNIVKCRPPGNRTPTEEEMNTCSPYLYWQLSILRPKVIVTLGRPASQTLLQTKTPISRLRGQFHDFPPPGLMDEGLPAAKLMPTFHPAYLLRSPGEKVKAWEDLKQVMAFLGIPIPPRG
ncbi:uracil-DNA glycosylase [uncultured Ilyobacter sp.]|uniref:uracil-DNA glycosylase n=1 Tax=uncultured Ilyobacter sp. TaxID=544433 RepID=UPI0029F58B8A|nr:uracil-DNA glycosylase [uncultured Ilyobacter sp.]